MEWLNLRDLQRAAEEVLDPKISDYIAGGAEDEVTARENLEAYTRLRLVPRVLCGAGKPDLSINLLGQKISMPILLSPTAFHRLVHDEGECATAKAARAADTVMIVSMAATQALETVVPHTEGRAWMQLYLQPDLAVMESLVRRAEDAGCKALVITVDSPVFGRRERDARNGFTDLPPGLYCENLREAIDGEPQSRVRSIAFSTELSWREFEWLRSHTSLKIIPKGVAHPEDARIAIECGADAIFISNHGGRQLDSMPATLDLLPEIAAEVDGRVPVLLDGGIRRGTDVVKALALGATAVSVGRPVMWGLAAGGTQGVVQMLEMLRAETERALALCGLAAPAQVSAGLLRHRPQQEELQCQL